jgi:hypothetical protein
MCLVLRGALHLAGTGFHQLPQTHLASQKLRDGKNTGYGMAGAWDSLKMRTSPPMPGASREPVPA